METVFTWVGGTGDWNNPFNWRYAEYDGPGLYDGGYSTSLVNGRPAAPRAPGASDTVAFAFNGGLVSGGGAAARVVTARDAGQIVLADTTADGRTDAYSFGSLDLNDRMLTVSGAVLVSKSTDIDVTSRLFLSETATAADQWGRTYSADLGALTLQTEFRPTGTYSGSVIAGARTVEADSLTGNAAVRTDAYNPASQQPYGGLYSTTGAGYLFDPAPTVSLKFLSSNGAASEGTMGVKGGGEVVFVATLDFASTSALTVGWLAGLRGGTTATPDDFLGGVLLSGVLAFAPGETSKVFTVRTAPDAAIEPDETFVVQLAGPSAGLNLGGPAPLFATILNDDFPPLPRVSASIDRPGLAEGGAGASTDYFFTARLDAASNVTQSVRWAVSGGSLSPTDAADFTGALSGTLIFDPGQTEKAILVRVAGDALVEADETFIVALSNPSTGLQVGQPWAVATVLNDDRTGPPPPVHVSEAQVAAYTAMADRMMHDLIDRGVWHI